MRCTYHGAIVVVDTRDVVGHVRYFGREGRKGIRVCFCGEESVDIMKCCTKSRFIIVEAGD